MLSGILLKLRSYFCRLLFVAEHDANTVGLYVVNFNRMVVEPPQIFTLMLIKRRSQITMARTSTYSCLRTV